MYLDLLNKYEPKILFAIFAKKIFKTRIISTKRAVCFQNLFLVYFYKSADAELFLKTFIMFCNQSLKLSFQLVFNVLIIQKWQRNGVHFWQVTRLIPNQSQNKQLGIHQPAWQAQKGEGGEFERKARGESMKRDQSRFALRLLTLRAQTPLPPLSTPATQARYTCEQGYIETTVDHF